MGESFGALSEGFSAAARRRCSLCNALRACRFAAVYGPPILDSCERAQLKPPGSKLPFVLHPPLARPSQPPPSLPPYTLQAIDLNSAGMLPGIPREAPAKLWTNMSPDHRAMDLLQGTFSFRFSAEVPPHVQVALQDSKVRGHPGARLASGNNVGQIVAAASLASSVPVLGSPLPPPAAAFRSYDAIVPRDSGAWGATVCPPVSKQQSYFGNWPTAGKRSPTRKPEGGQVRSRRRICC